MANGGEEWDMHTPSVEGSSISKIIKFFSGEVKNTIIMQNVPISKF